MHRDRAQEVKRVVERLRADGRHEAVAHNRVWRPWGFYDVLTRDERFGVRRLLLRPGQRLSLQKPLHRAVHWVVVSGTALAARDDEEHVLHEGESLYMPQGSVHRLENPGRTPLVVIEIYTGSHLGKDDTVHPDDADGRR
jgi:mannose-1-phosphate guanylyltransferase/mannose-6-phosphate isomerase